MKEPKEEQGAKSIPPLLDVNTNQLFSSSFCGIASSKQVWFLNINECASSERKRLKRKEKYLCDHGDLEQGEEIHGVFEEIGYVPSFEQVLRFICLGRREIQVDKDFYDELLCLILDDVDVNTKYKTVEEKVKPAAIPLPPEARYLIERASKEPSLRDRDKIGHTFTK